MNHSELLVWANSSFREDYQVPLLKAQQLDMHLQSQSGEMVLYVETWETGGYQTHNCHLTYTTKGLCIPGNIEVKIWLGSLSKAGLKGIFNPDLSLVIPSETEARKIRPDMPNVEIENVTKRLARAKQYPLVLALDTLPQVYSELRLRTLLEEINESSGKLLRRDLNSKFPYLRHEIFSYLTLENCGFKADLRQKKVEEIGISEGTFFGNDPDLMQEAILYTGKERVQEELIKLTGNPKLKELMGLPQLIELIMREQNGTI